MKVSILTLGCKVNQAESAFIARKVAERGVTLVELCERPDYCVINTCTVTAKSDYQSRQLVRRAVKSGAKVIVTGCYAQVNPDEVRRIGGIFGVVANDKKNSIINIIEYCTSSKGLYVGSRSRPCVKVQDGCNNACAYCIVPKARGRSRSAEVSSILREISELESEGYQEVVLTGINLGSFGHDFQPRFSLAGLIRRILDETGICRLRLSSVEVNEIDDELIELFSERRICRHIHIPLQSGDDLILRLMRRRYNVRDFISAVTLVQNRI